MSFSDDQENKIKEIVGLYEGGVVTPAIGTKAAHIANLGVTVAKTDVDDAGTIDGTEVAAALQAIHVKINTIVAVLEAFNMTALS